MNSSEETLPQALEGPLLSEQVLLFDCETPDVNRLARLMVPGIQALEQRVEDLEEQVYNDDEDEEDEDDEGPSAEQVALDAIPIIVGLAQLVDAAFAHNRWLREDGTLALSCPPELASEFRKLAAGTTGFIKTYASVGQPTVLAGPEEAP